mmetsp:Transcript_409/g.848  ORF Transcript_409/g.848 Transcript_409/m.848 type:complete len:124 (-) Transcript_409:723-1094(-)
MALELPQILAVTSGHFPAALDSFGFPLDWTSLSALLPKVVGHRRRPGPSHWTAADRRQVAKAADVPEDPESLPTPSCFHVDWCLRGTQSEELNLWLSHLASPSYPAHFLPSRQLGLAVLPGSD